MGDRPTRHRKHLTVEVLVLGVAGSLEREVLGVAHPGDRERDHASSVALRGGGSPETSNLRTMEQREDQAIRAFDDTGFGVLGEDELLPPLDDLEFVSLLA